MIAHHTAKGLASLGRGNDTMLMHVTPREVAGLQSIAKSMGGSLTMNPHTGLPEAGFFDFIGSLLPTIAGIATGAFFPEFSPWLVGAGIGGITAAATGSPIKGLMAGLGAGSGFGIGNAASSAFGAPTALAESGAGSAVGLNPLGTLGSSPDSLTSLYSSSATAPGITSGDISSLVNNTSAVDTGLPGAGLPETGLSFNTAPTGVQLPSDALAKGLQTGVSTPSVADTLSSYGDKFSKFSDKLGGPVATFAKLAVPTYMAARDSGMLTPDPLPKNSQELYDPNARLNLANINTGLRLDPNMTGASLTGKTGGEIPHGLHGYKQHVPGGISNIYAAKGGYLDGPGDGMSDSIPGVIANKRPARLADGEFVIPADVVSHLGNGSTDAGAKQLYAMMNKVRQARTGNKKQGKQINPRKLMPA